MESHEADGGIQPKIVRGRVASLSLYEITDYELQVLEGGTAGSTFLNFSIALLSIAVSVLVTLVTTKIESNRTFAVFVVLVVVGFTLGGLLLVLWYRARRSMSKVLKRIRDRCLPQSQPFEDSSEAPTRGRESAG